MGHKLKDLLSELSTLRNRLLYDLSIMEFNAKMGGGNTPSLDNLIYLYKDMIDDVDDLIEKYR